MNPQPTTIDKLVGAVIGLARALEAACHNQHHMASIERKVTDTMSAISDFVARQNQFNNRLDAAIDGIAADVRGLKELVTKLQNTAGAITPEDQALLDQLENRVSATVAKVEALDSLTPPEAPEEPATPTPTE